MAEYKLLTKETEVKVYFAHPQSPWERGTNENTNGLIRQFFPKGVDFNQISRKEIKRAERLLNERPRKVLGFKTPYEIMQQLSFKMPDDLSKICLQVLGIFFGSKLSGKIYSMKQEAKDFQTELGGRKDRVLALIQEKGQITTGDAAKLLGLSKPTARRIMNELEKAGKVKQEGVGRGIYYVAA